MVSRSARTWVGCASSVSPFHTGTFEKRAISSTTLWWNPRYSMPSNMRPSTRAVSFNDSFLPSCDPTESR